MDRSTILRSTRRAGHTTDSNLIINLINNSRCPRKRGKRLRLRGGIQLPHPQSEDEPLEVLLSAGRAPTMMLAVRISPTSAADLAFPSLLCVSLYTTFRYIPLVFNSFFAAAF
eukprot:Opistho-2@86622